ncbi:MAG: hypothetical protein RJA36_1770 [Pseudomonadota bacterium]|jgi:hypothetical protein
MAASARKRRPKIPKTFAVMGHTITVKRIPASRWKAGKSCVGYFDPATLTIAVCAGIAPTAQEQTFWHEVTHCLLFALNSPHYENEEFVDQVGGLLHQIVSSLEF